MRTEKEVEEESADWEQDEAGHGDEAAVDGEEEEERMSVRQCPT